MRMIAGQETEVSTLAGISMPKGCIRQGDLRDKEVKPPPWTRPHRRPKVHQRPLHDQNLLDCLAHHELIAAAAGLGFCITILIDVQKPRPDYRSPSH